MNDDASKAFVPYIDLVGRQNDHSVNTVLNLLVHSFGEQEDSPDLWGPYCC